MGQGYGWVSPSPNLQVEELELGCIVELQHQALVLPRLG